MPAASIPASRTSKRAIGHFLILAASFSWILCAEPSLRADELTPPGTTDENRKDSARLATDRKTTVVLEQLINHLAAGESNEAVEDFRRLQTSDASVMVPTAADGAQFGPLFKRVFELFHELPALQRRRIAKDGRFGANRDLQEVVAESRFESIPDFILHHAGTEASLKAHILLARLHMERGNALGAKSWLQPLSLPNVDDSYRQTALRILSDLTIEHEQQQEAPAEVSNSQIPQHVRWQFHPQVSPKVRQQLDRFSTAALDAKITPQTTWSDLADTKSAYRRTLRGVIAVDLNTGGPRWQYPIDPQLDASLASDRSSASAFAQRPTTQLTTNRFSMLENTALVNAFCIDNITGQVTSDAQRLYLVKNMGNPAVATSAAMLGFFARSSNTTFRGSQLVALEKETGRRIWSAGNSAFENDGETPANTWFAGVPARENNLLYSVVEINAEIRLACFRSQTGERLWDTSLAWPEQSIDKDPYRQLWSATPTVKQGMVFCPTTTGWMTCVDQFTRSVLWAHRLRTQKKVVVTPSRRGRPVVLTMPSSLRERWALAKVVNAGEKLILMPHEAHDILIVDAITGKLTNRIPMKSATVLIHIDETAIVYCEEKKIVCRNPVTGDTKWSHELASEDGLPTGLAVAQNNSLLVPMSTGAIASIAFETGEIAETMPGVLPRLPWGNLTSLNPQDESPDFLYIAPDRLLRLSAKPSRSPSGSPVETANDLMIAGKWQDALSRAENVPADDPAYKAADDICFRCRMRLAIDSPDAHLPHLTTMAKSSERQLQLQILKTRILLNQQKPVDAATGLAELLKMPAARLQQQSVDFGERIKNETDGNAFPTSRSLQTWAASTLTGLLNENSDTTAIVSQLNDVPDAVLMTLHHETILPIVYDRIPKTASIESSLQLLNHAIRLKLNSSAPSTEFSREAQLLTQIVSRIQKLSNVAEREAAMLLLNVAVLETNSNFSASPKVQNLFRSGVFHTQKALQQRQRKQIKDRLGEWSTDSYSAIPVARMTSSGRVRTSLTFANTDDPFFTNFAWSATSGEAGRLNAQTLRNQSDHRWSIPGDFRLYGNYSNRQDVLHRAGSVILLKSWTSLTAVSVLDRSVLWSRRFKDESTSHIATTPENFARFNLRTTPPPSRRSASPFEIVGSGAGWVALTYADEFSMIDISTGNTLWSFEFKSDNTDIVASGNTIVAISNGQQIAALDAKSGNKITLPKTFDNTCLPIRNVGNLFVCWKQSLKTNDQALQWIDPQSSNVIAEIDLSAMQQFHFVDDDTLAGFSNQHQLQLVDMLNQSSETFSFAAPQQTEAAEEDDTETPPESPLWSARRLQVTTDGLNIYLANRRKQKSRSMNGPSNRNMMAFTGDLQAIDRQTGELAWHFQNDEDLFATTDERNLPLLLLIRPPIRKADGTIPSRYIFHGITRLSGKQVLKQVVPTTGGLRMLSLTSNALNSIDVEVPGLSMRIEGKSATQEETPQQ